MGKVKSLIAAKKRRDKKYDPYKLNPLHNKLTNAVKGSDLETAIERNEKGEILLDSAGKPIFKDCIEWDTDSAEIMAIWTAIRACIEEKIVPPNELDACFDLMEVYAREHREGSTKKYKITIPINYFVGTWHILNSVRKFHLLADDKSFDEAIDRLTLWFAKRIDMYHEVKRREKIEEKVKPADILRPSGGKVIEFNKDYYKEDGAQ